MKKIISIILAVSIICGFTVSVAAISGEGTELNPYLISTPEDLMAISNDLTSHYKLTNDIDMSSVIDYEPIGNAIDGAFTGSLDGAGFTISNLTVDLPGEKYTGLFGYSEGDIRNLTLSDIYLVGGRYVGGIAGYIGTGSTVENCKVGGYICSENALVEACAGGISGVNNGTIENCISEAEIIVLGEELEGFCTYVGGFAGKMVGIVNDSSVFGKISHKVSSADGDEESGRVYMGGFVGTLDGTINNGESVSTIAAAYPSGYYSEDIYIGGFAGYSEGDSEIIDSSFSGQISTKNLPTFGYAGGLVGYASGNSLMLSNCKNYSKINIPYYSGGLIGIASSSINLSDCCNYGDCSGSYGSGGLVGSLGTKDKTYYINNSHNYGSGVNGGIIGYIADGTVAVSNCSNYGNVYQGGIVGELYGDDRRSASVAITSCINYGDVNGATSGGIIGESNWGGCTIYQSCNFGSVKSSSKAGGIVGQAERLKISECFNNGSVVCIVDSNASCYAAGICGSGQHIDVSDCYNIGYIEAKSSAGIASGIIAQTYYSSYSGGGYLYLNRCYNAGTILSQNVASIVYSVGNYKNFIENSNYYLSDSLIIGYYGIIINSEKSLTDLEMKSESNFDFDFNEIWCVDSNLNNGYPMLRCFENQYTMNLSRSNILINESVNLVPYINGNSVKNVTWTSSNKKIASVSSDGMVIGVDSGTATITAVTSNGNKINSCVTVIKPSGGFNVKVSSVNAGDVVTATITPKDPSSNDIIVERKSTDESTAVIYTYDSGGFSRESGSYEVDIKGVSYGVCTITATSYLGEKVTFDVTVTANATSISLPSTLTVNREKTATLTPTITPSPTTSALTWSSSNENVATIDENGVITGVSCGQAVITVQTDNGYSATCTVTVKAPVETLTMDQTSITVTKGFTDKVVAVPDPLDTTDTITYSSSSSSYVSVNSSTGVITGNRVGTATITATASSGAKAYCTVTVLEVETPVTGITLDRDEINIHGGELVTLSPTVLPATATNKQLVWSVEDLSIATVTQTGVVKGISTGTTVVTATTLEGGHSVSCTVNVVIDVTDVKLDADHLDMNTDETAQLTATVLPENATNKNVKWTSSAENIATVDENGVVTAVSQGVAIITVTTDDWNKSVTCFVTVTEPVDSIVLSSTSASVVLNETLALTASLIPADATYPDIVWTSSDETVATVDENGVITANKLGNATITATAHNGITAECEIYVVSFEGAEYTEFASQKTEDGTAVIINEYCGTSSEVIIPRAIGGLPVTTIGSNLFANCEQTIETLTISETVTEIEADSIDSSVGKILCYENSAAHAYAEANRLNYELIFEMTISTHAATLYKGDDMQLSLSITPSTMANSAITWTSSNIAVVYVDENGNISAKKQGSAVITATDELGNKITCTIRVIPRTPTIMIYNFDHSYEYKVDWWKPYSSAKMRLGRYTYNCEDAVRYEWTSSNSRVKIDQDGNITNTGFFGRSSTITVKAYDADGNVLATKSVKVVFYKFKWQRDKLQTQSIVSDNYIDHNVPEQTLEKTTENETVAIFSYFIEYIEKIFKSLIFLK